MIPVDIDNFIVYEILNYKRNWSIYIKNADILPKELSNCSYLAKLCLYNNNIVDISALSNCTYLNELHLSNNKIVNISALSNCTSLTRVCLCSNKIVDISALSKCKNLKFLDVRDNHIKSKIKFHNYIDIDVYY